MAITKSTDTRNASCNLIVDRIDLGTTYSAGNLSIYNSDSTLISTNTLSNPAFGSASDGTAACNFIYDTTAVTDGTASYFQFNDRDGTMVFRGSVTASGGGGDLILSNITISADTTVSITPGYYVVP